MGLLDLKQIKCKTCGEPLDLSKAHNGVVKCGVCDSVFTLPKDSAEQKVLDYLFQAEGDLDTGRFDDAYTKFAKAAELDKTEPEAYWGMALATFKIQYLKDEVNNRLQPVCYEINDKKFLENRNYLKAFELATDEQKEVYSAKAGEIDYIKSEFFKLKKRGVKYDCFICVKVSKNLEDNEKNIKNQSDEKTADSEFAHQIYRMLKNNSYMPFFSEAVLKNVTGADYEAHILYALSTSETMLVICFDEAYLRTKWVKNEYTRFLKLVNDEEKESDSITLIYRGKPVEKLPGKNGKIQGIDANELDCSHRILQFVESHTPEAKRKREEEARRKDKESEALRNELAELKKMLLNQQAAKTSGEEKAKEQARLQAEEERQKKERKERETREAAERARTEEEIKRKAEEEKARREREIREAEARARTAEQEAERIRLTVEKTKYGSLNSINCRTCGTTLYLNNAVDGVITCNFCGKRHILPKSDASQEERKTLQECEREASKIAKAYLTLDLKDDFGIISGNPLHFARGKILKCMTCGGGLYIPNYARCVVKCEHCHRVCSVNEEVKYALIACDFEIENGVLKKYEGIAEEVIIPDNVTSIGGAAFRHCEGLTSITIPNSVTSIGEEAFSGCEGLTSITIPNSVTSIGERAFDGCSGLTSITIPNNVTSISEGAFSSCSGLTSITIPNSVTIIGDFAFWRCSGLTSITIPNSVTSIGYSTFSGCRGLTSITIPDSVTNIGVMAFNCCSGLTSIDLPNRETSIGELAFGGCGGLTSITIPNSVKSIGKRAFYDCVGLTSVTIPNSVMSIGDSAFEDCIKLKTIYCRSEKQPNGWRKDWNKKNDKLIGGKHKVVWGYEGE